MTDSKTKMRFEPGYGLFRAYDEFINRADPLYLINSPYVRTYGAAFNSFGEVEIQGALADKTKTREENAKMLINDFRQISKELELLGYPISKWRHNNGIFIKDARKPGDRTEYEIIEFLMK